MSYAFKIWTTEGTEQRRVAQAIVGTAVNALTGALAGHIFHIINPVGGAIFAVASRLASDVIESTRYFDFRYSEVEKVARFIISWFGAILPAMAAVWLAGIHISFGACIIMQVALLPASFVTYGIYKFFVQRMS